MAEYADREHYLPLRKSDLIDLLCKDKKLDVREREPFRQFCRLVSSIWHFEYLTRLEKLKDAYAPFDPDSTCKQLKEVSADEKPALMAGLFDEFVSLMERANFKHLGRQDIEAAVEGGASDWGINMTVDWNVFERIELFARGDGQSRRTKRHPIFFWKKEEKSVETYQRLVLLLKLRKHKRLPESIDTNGVFLKMFKDIPKLDLEMVLPGTSMQMPTFTKGKLGVSLIGSLGYIVYSVGWQIWTGVKVLLGLTVAAASAAVNVLWGPVIALAGYGYKQYYSYQVTRQTYAKQLTESLYFQNLDNNAGVITQVLDEAEEQECRETFLAWFYLWKYAPAEGWTAAALDDYVELELERLANIKFDFEIEDALDKLLELKIATKQGDHYRAVPLVSALEKLDYRWDNYFKYNQA